MPMPHINSVHSTSLTYFNIVPSVILSENRAFLYEFFNSEFSVPPFLSHMGFMSLSLYNKPYNRVNVEW
jgi:hypothetical protein